LVENGDAPGRKSFGHKRDDVLDTLLQLPSRCHLTFDSSIIFLFFAIVFFLSRVHSKGTPDYHRIKSTSKSFSEPKELLLQYQLIYLSPATTTQKHPTWTTHGKKQPSPPATCTTANPATTAPKPAAAAENQNAQPSTSVNALAHIR
jgi:hypothetical protein